MAVEIFNKTRRRIYFKNLIEKTIKAVLGHFGSDKAIISVILVGDKEMLKLNRFWRKKNKPTSVLSFPDYFSGVKSFAGREAGVKYLGETILNVDSASKKARGNKELFSMEARKLLIHSALHLLGYNHRRGEKIEQGLIKEIVNSKQ